MKNIKSWLIVLHLILKRGKVSHPYQDSIAVWKWDRDFYPEYK